VAPCQLGTCLFASVRFEPELCVSCFFSLVLEIFSAAMDPLEVHLETRASKGQIKVKL
jgi:hypothetical protein